MQQLYIDDDVIDRSIRKHAHKLHIIKTSRLVCTHTGRTSGILIGFIYLAFETVSAAYIYMFYTFSFLSFFLSRKVCNEKVVLGLKIQ